MSTLCRFSSALVVAVSLSIVTVSRIGHTADQPGTSAPNESALDARPRLDLEISPLYTFGKDFTRESATAGLGALVALRHSNFLLGLHADARINAYFPMTSGTVVLGPSFLMRSGLRFDALLEAGVHHIGWVGVGEPVRSGPSANVATFGLRVGAAYQGRAPTSGIVGLWVFARYDARRSVETWTLGYGHSSVVVGQTILGISGRFGTSYGL